MKEEIKDLLQYLKNIYESEETSTWLNKLQIKDLLDYITNLQEENERLEIKCDFLVGKKMVELDKNAKQLEIKAIEQQDYKTRIDKAIEYIENDMPYLEEPDEEIERCDGTIYMTMKEYDKSVLLNILQGSDE